ncbi:MAG: cell envelope integrity protein TolA [Marinomonas hwangdonensis]|nr:cell envelope integrity protein TolA [Marinomonas hwangdonensis]
MKWLRTESYHIPTILAISLHLGIVIVGLVVADFSSSEPPEPKRPPIVNATVVDVSETIIGKREAEQRAAEQAALAEERRRQAQQKADSERRALEERRNQLAREKQAQEAAKQKELERQRQAQKLEQERAAKQAEEKRRLEKQLAEKQLAERQLAEKQRIEEQARKEAEAKRAQEERQRQQEEQRLEQERQRQAEAAKIAEQKRAEEAAAQAAAEEKKKKAAEEAQMVQSISSLINSRVAAVWSRPPSARNNMRTQLRIDFLPNGEVLNVQIMKGSGDALFDARAVDAVYKVRRIEELAQVDSYVFERNFRTVELIFNPQDLRN